MTRTLAGFASGDVVRVRWWDSGGGTRMFDVGRLGTVRRVARTRLVVDLDESGGYIAETRHIHPDCLRLA